MKALILVLLLAVAQPPYRFVGRLGPVQLWKGANQVLLRYQSARVQLSEHQFQTLVTLLRQQREGRVGTAVVAQFAGGTNLRLEEIDVPLAPPDIALAEPAFEAMLKSSR